MKLAIFLGLIVLLLSYLVVLYNALVNLKHSVSKNWANIDVLLKQRHDELPKLVEVCKQYAQFEQGTLVRVMEARRSIADAAHSQDLERLGHAETQLRGLVAQLNAVVEAYPQLKADEQFGQLLVRISQLEDALADRRELYNEAVTINNVRIEQFPDVLVARLFGFELARPLRFSAAQIKDVNLTELFQNGQLAKSE
ncbi:LemA family protein [Neisseriaceae bacterium TC5R-5]|nr:LemA family protein [Neisseriaceae bacterium TC5R-5]